MRNNLNDRCTGRPNIIPSSSPPSSESSKFKAGFNECARIVREVLHNQPQQTIEGDLQKRVSQYLEQCLTNLLVPELVNRKSPSPSLGSDSCTSFEDKDIDHSEFLINGFSPANRRVCSSSSVSEESQDSCSRRSFSNEINSFELTSTPNSSPRNGLNTIPSSRTCGYESVPLYVSPDLTVGILNQGKKWENHQVVPSFIPRESKSQSNDAADLLACGFPTTSVFSSDSFSNSLTSPINQQYQYSPEAIYRPQNSLYDDHILFSFSKSNAEQLKVWRPW